MIQSLPVFKALGGFNRLSLSQGGARQVDVGSDQPHQWGDYRAGLYGRRGWRAPLCGRGARFGMLETVSRWFLLVVSWTEWKWTLDESTWRIRPKSCLSFVLIANTILKRGRWYRSRLGPQEVYHWSMAVSSSESQTLSRAGITREEWPLLKQWRSGCKRCLMSYHWSLLEFTWIVCDFVSTYSFSLFPKTAAANSSHDLPSDPVSGFPPKKDLPSYT